MLLVPQTNIINRVFCILFNNSTGTAFTVNIDDNKQYLITAKHVVESANICEKNNISIFHENVWKTLNCEIFFIKDSQSDIAIIKLDYPLSPNFEMPLSRGGMLYGQDVFFLGFPYFGQQIKYDPCNINNNFPYPFIKKAVCSAVTFLEGNENIIYLDGHNNPGFSGGPVIFYDYKHKIFKICSVVSGYLCHFGNIVTPTDLSEPYYRENSGIIVSYGIKYLNEIIEKYNLEKIKNLNLPYSQEQ